MIAITTRTKFHREALRKRAREGSFRSLYQAAAFIRTTARRSIRRTKKNRPSPPGRPAHSRGRAKHKMAMLFHVDKLKGIAVIGFTRSVMGTSMAAHEHGIRRFGRQYPSRSIMRPALRKAAPRIPAHWRSTVR